MCRIDNQRPIRVMGIINLTPDSFYEPSRYNLSIFDSGADIIDIGACSTRPGHTPVGEDEEWNRLEPVIWDISRHHPGHTISIDSYWSAVIRKVHKYLGPNFIVNDVSAGSVDPDLLPTVAALHLPYIAMHGFAEASESGQGRSRESISRRGELSANEAPASAEKCSRAGASGPASVQGPESISRRGDLSASRALDHEQGEPGASITDEVEDFFDNFSAKLSALGIDDWYLDPGFGFGKDVRQNLELLDALPRLRRFHRPILVGISRKRMTWQPLGITPDQALQETGRLHLKALRGGADILRVHDVAQAREVISMYRKN